LKERVYEGQTWRQVADEIISKLPEKVYISFDVDGLDPKLCPNSGTPVQGGMETEQIFYIFNKLIKNGKKLIGFDLNETGVGENDWDSNVSSRIFSSFVICWWQVTVRLFTQRNYLFNFPLRRTLVRSVILFSNETI
jgi:arginase family enzyme